MSTFEEYQALATKAPLYLRNNLDRINLPVMGLQEEAGRIGSLLARASASGSFSLTPEQSSKLQEFLVSSLRGWYLSRL